jgi:hypothetical protein
MGMGTGTKMCQHGSVTADHGPAKDWINLLLAHYRATLTTLRLMTK